MPKDQRRFAKIGLSLFASFAALVFVECALRAFAPVTYLQPREEMVETPWNQLVHQKSAIPGLDYELRPNLDREALGVRIQTNSFGLRDRERAMAKDAGLFRIAALGDSFTFGHGVEADQAWPSALERTLNAQFEQPPFEVMNFGVEGYSIRDAALVLRYKVMRWDPDMVILGYVGNDPETDPIQPLHAYFHDAVWWQRSHLARLVAQCKQSRDINRYGPRYIEYLHRDPDKWAAVPSAMDLIREDVTGRDIPVVVAIFPIKRWMADQVAEAATSRGFHVVFLGPAFSQKSNGEPIRLENDAHPNPLGHSITAEILAEELVGGPIPAH